jgi:MFS family permease
VEKFEFSPENANKVNSMIYLISAIGCPLFGYIIDKFGKNIMWTFLSIFVTIFGFIILAFTSWNPYFGVCLMGVAFSIWASSIWPIIAFVIPEYQLGTAFGM